MSDDLKLTAQQYKALKNWANGKPGNEVAYKVRSDVCDRLRRRGFLISPYLLQRRITEKGIEALRAYEARMVDK